MTTSSTPEPKPRAPSKKKVSTLDVLAERSKQIAIAIKLLRTYEFIGDGNSLTMSAEEPAVNHSWTMEQRVTLESERVRHFSVGTGTNAAVPIPVGLTAVMGKSGTGKTRFTFEHIFARAIRDGLTDIRYYRMFEPGIAADLMAFSEFAEVPSFEAEMAISLAADLLSDEVDTIIIDSGRYMFYSSSGGATGKGGVNMSLFMDLTHLDIVASQLGKRVILVINPLTDDDAAFSAYVEAALGAVACTAVMKAFDSIEMSSRYAPTRNFTSYKLGTNTVLNGVLPVAADIPEVISMTGGVETNIGDTLFDRKGR